MVLHEEFIHERQACSTLCRICDRYEKLFTHNMLAIRLSRVGKKKNASYRIIVNEKTKDPWGDYKEKLGHYNPFTKELVINKERVKFYLDNGAQASETVWNLFVENKVIEGKKQSVSHINKKRAKKMVDAKAAEEKARQDAEEAARAEKEAQKAATEAAAQKPAPEATPEVAPEAAPEAVPTEETAS